MSEARLWIRLREAVGSAGHFERREFNPLGGVPDVSYCVTGVEGHIELKYMPFLPKRLTTAVFGPRSSRGMRESQIAWFDRRLRAGGRAYILAQVENRLVLLHGAWAERFNEMVWDEMRKMCCWSGGPTIPQYGPGSWRTFLGAITKR